VGAENQKPPINSLEELKNLDQQVERVTDLNDLKPIFLRLDEIAKQQPDDFEVQLVIGDIKQHLVNRGTQLKEQRPPAPPPIPGPSAPLPPTVKAPRIPPAGPPPIPGPAATPPVRLMSSDQFVSPPAPRPPAASPNPPLPATRPIHIPPRPNAPPPTSTIQMQTPGPLNTGQQPPMMANADPMGAPPSAPPGLPPRVPPQLPGQNAPSPRLPGQPLNWKRSLLIGAMIGAVATIAVITLLVNQARKHLRTTETATAMIDVNFTTTPPQAAIRVNGDARCTSPCTAQLAPGTYQITAFLDGYDPAASSVNVVAGQPANVQLALNALPQSVRILTDLEQGKIALDDQPPVDLQEGQYTFDKIAPGAHTMKLTSKGGEASFSFSITEARPPELTGTVTARNLSAVLVSSLGSQARVFTNSGPVKLAVNGQPEGDAGPAGVDVKNFHAGPDEIVVGDGKDQHTLNETFTPAPMLTAFFKSDVNLGTLVVVTGEDGASVFLNGKLYRHRTQKGQVRIPAIGEVSVRVSKDGFEFAPAQTAEVKKGSEVRLEFKLKALPTTATLEIRGAAPGTEVLLDQKAIGSVGVDGSLNSGAISPGDHTIDLRHDQYMPKHLQRSFKAGQTVVLSGQDVLLAAAATNGTIRLARTPPDATVTYRRADETQPHELRGPQIELPAGTYIFAGHAQGYSDKQERVQIAVGETRSVELALARIAVPVVKVGTMADFVDPAAWDREGELWTHRGGGFIPYKLGPRGVYTFTVELVHGGNVFRGGRIRWVVQYVDSKNYLLYELDHKNFWAEVVQNGKKFEREKTQHDLEKQKAFTIQIEITPEHCVHRIRNASGQWMVLDSFSEPGRDFTKGKFGFLIQGNDEIGVSDFSFTPK